MAVLGREHLDLDRLGLVVGLLATLGRRTGGTAARRAERGGRRRGQDGDAEAPARGG